MRSESSFATATEDKRETRERRERAREKARLKASERGRSIAFPNDREKDLSPAAAAPLGDWRESNPRVRPSSVVPPRGRARWAGRVFGVKRVGTLELLSALGVWGLRPHAANRTEAVAIALRKHLLKI